MGIIKVRSQADIEALPSAFEDETRIDVVFRGAEISFVPRNGIFVAWENSTVTARENSTVTARENSVKIKELLHSSVLINRGVDVVPTKRDKSARVVSQKLWQHTQKSFLDIYPADDDGYVTLYKVTRDDGTDYYTGKIKYEGVVGCPDWDKDRNRQCGGGLHLSPEPHLALQYHQGPVKTCRVHRDDFVVFPGDITKVRCRKVEVLP